MSGQFLYKNNNDDKAPPYNILVSIANLGNECSNESALVLEHSLLALR